MTEKTFTLWGEQQKKSCLNFIGALPPEPVQQVTIREHEKGRTIDQNSRYWSLLQLIADNVQDNGLHSNLWWHYRLRCEWGYVIGTCQMRVGGVMIDVPMPISTTKMSTAQMSDYQERLVQMLVEHGVPLPQWVD